MVGRRSSCAPSPVMAMTDPNGSDDALEKTLAEAVSLTNALLEARQKDEQELVDQVAKISSAKAAAALKAKDRLTARLDDRRLERESAERIAAALAQVQEQGGGRSKAAQQEAEEAKAKAAALKEERDALQASLDDQKKTFEEEREAFGREKEEWAQERSALEEGRASLEEERDKLKAELEEREKDLEESAAEAARAMSELRDEIEKKSREELGAAKEANADLVRRVDDLQLLVKVKTEMMEKFEKVIGDRDTSIQSLIADVEEKGETIAHLHENLSALRADYAAKEKAASAHEAKATAYTTVIDTLKQQLSKTSEEKQRLEGILISRSNTIDELQSLVRVLSGDTDVEFAELSDEPVSLPGGAPVEDDPDGAMPAPVDVGSLPDAPPASSAAVANSENDEFDADDNEEAVLIEEDLPMQTGEIARAAALAAAAQVESQASPQSVEEAIAAATTEDAGDLENGHADVDVDVSGWADAVDADDDEAPLPHLVENAPLNRVEDPMEETFFGVDVDVEKESSDASEIDLGDIEIEEDVRPLSDEDVVQKTDALDAYDCKGAEEIKLAGILSHQPWRVEEITKLTKLDGAFVREKLGEFARSGLIEVVD